MMTIELKLTDNHLNIQYTNMMTITVNVKPKDKQTNALNCYTSKYSENILNLPNKTKCSVVEGILF